MKARKTKADTPPVLRWGCYVRPVVANTSVTPSPPKQASKNNQMSLPSPQKQKAKGKKEDRESPSHC